MIKKNIVLIIMATIFIFTLASKAEASNMDFAVVDMQKVMETTDVAKDIFKQLDSKRKEFQKEISKEEKKLRAQEKIILKDKDNLSKNEFQKKRKEFESKLIKGQKIVQGRKRTLDYALNDSISKLRNAAIKVVADVARSRGFSAVFSKETVVMSDPSMDITADVVTKMNNNIQKFKVDWKASNIPSKHSK